MKPKTQKLHQICMSIPNFNLLTERECQECGVSYDDEPEDERDNFGDDVTEFCNTCLGELFAHLEYLERVYIVVPDLRPATRADTQQVFRYGDPAAQRRLLAEAERSDPNHQTLSSDAFEVDPVPDSVASQFDAPRGLMGTSTSYLYFCSLLLSVKTANRLGFSPLSSH